MSDGIEELVGSSCEASSDGAFTSSSELSSDAAVSASVDGASASSDSSSTRSGGVPPRRGVPMAPVEDLRDIPPR